MRQHASMCINMRQYAWPNMHHYACIMHQYVLICVALCINMRQHASMCINMRQLALPNMRHHALWFMMPQLASVFTTRRPCHAHNITSKYTVCKNVIYYCNERPTWFLVHKSPAAGKFVDWKYKFVHRAGATCQCMGDVVWTTTPPCHNCPFAAVV